MKTIFIFLLSFALCVGNVFAQKTYSFSESSDEDQKKETNTTKTIQPANNADKSFNFGKPSSESESFEVSGEYEKDKVVEDILSSPATKRELNILLESINDLKERVLSLEDKLEAFEILMTLEAESGTSQKMKTRKEKRMEKRKKY